MSIHPAVSEMFFVWTERNRLADQAENAIFSDMLQAWQKMLLSQVFQL